MADRVTRILLEIMALDKATSVLKSMMTSLQGWADTVNHAGESTTLTSEQMEAVQVRLQGASDAYDASLENQAVALGKLGAAQSAVADAQRTAVAAQLEAQQASMDAATASSADAQALTAYAATAVRAAAEAADAVKLSVDEQVAAYDKLLAADALVEKRTAQVADAQMAAGMESEDSSVKLGKVGPVMLAAGAAAVYLTAKSVELAANFQTSMTKLVTSAGESQSALAAVGAGVLQISDQTGIAASDLAKALYYVDSANIHGAQSLQVLAAAAKGARDEQADVASVTNALTTVMTNYNMQSSQSTLVMNEMITAVSLGKTNLQEFSVALAQVLPLAAANNVSFAQVGAALASMTAKGMTAQQAAQDLAFSIRALSKPNGVAITELGQLGLSSEQVQKSLGNGPDGLSNTFLLLSNTVLQHMGPAGTLLLSTFNQSQDAASKAKAMFDSMPPALHQLASELEGGSISAHNWALAIRNLDGPQQKMMQQFASMYEGSQAFSNVVTSRATPAAQTYATAMSNLMGGAAGLNTALMLVGKQGVGAFATNVEKMDAVARRANKEVDGWAVVQGTFNQKLSEAKQTIINTGIALGTVLLPYVTKFMDTILKILIPIGAWITQHQKLVGLILAIAGPILTFVGVVITLSKVIGLAKAAVTLFKDSLMDLLANPVVLAVLAIAVAAYLIVTHWTAVKKFLLSLWDWLKKSAKDVADFFVRIWKDVATFSERVWNDIAGFFKRIWGDVSSFATRIWNDITGFFKRIWNDIAGFFTGVWDKIVGIAERGVASVAGPITREWTRIQKDLKAIWGELVTIWNDTGGKLVALIARNWGSVEDIASDTWNKIVAIIKKIGDGILAVWNFVSTKTTQAWNIIATFLRFEWDNIWNVVKFYLSVIETIISTTWDLIQGAAITAWDAITGILKAAWDLMYGIIKAALDVITGILKAAWEAIKTVVKVVWDYVTGIINTALDFIKDILKVFIDLITGKWGQMWQDIKKTASDVLNNVVGFVGKILGDIIGFFGKAARDIGSGFLGGLESLGSGAWKALGDLWNTITGFFSNAITWLWNAGADLVQGLINGIENWASNLWNSLSNLVTGILGRIGKFLGLGSPSRITHQYGIYLVEGLINGINASAQKAAGAARSLALGVLAGAQGTLGTVTLAAGGTGTGSLFAGAPGGLARGQVAVTNDFRGAYITGPQAMQWVMDQINRNFVQKVAPTAGVVTRRT